MSRTLAEEGLTIPDAPAEPGEFERSLRATRESGRKLLVAYVTGGLHDEWPDVVRAVADAGADAIEIGIPFSDPVMDGPVIQEASELALRDEALGGELVFRAAQRKIGEVLLVAEGGVQGALVKVRLREISREAGKTRGRGETNPRRKRQNCRTGGCDYGSARGARIASDRLEQADF